MPQAAATKKTTPSWRSIYPVHPCADVFPMMNKEDLDALAADIKAQGLQTFVTLYRASDGALFVLDGRNRLEALARLGVTIPKDPHTVARLPHKKTQHIFDILQQATTDPTTFVISANIRRRHLSKEQQAELIVKTIEAGQSNDGAKVARSFSPTPGEKGGSTKDPVLDAAVAEGKKHDISKRTIQRARAKVQGKKPAPPKPKPKPKPMPTPATAKDQSLGSGTLIAVAPIATETNPPRAPEPKAATETVTTTTRQPEQPATAVGDLLNALFQLKQKHGEETVRRALSEIVSSPKSAWCLNQRVSA